MSTWQDRLAHRFVEQIPEQVEPGELYISLRYTTAVHQCVCGCGHEVVTPLSPTDWKVTFSGQSVSPHPSIGNWSLPCQSHYWIRNDRVHRARRQSAQQIAEGRAQDRVATQGWLQSLDDTDTPAHSGLESTGVRGRLRRALRRLTGQ